MLLMKCLKLKAHRAQEAKMRNENSFKKRKKIQSLYICSFKAGWEALIISEIKESLVNQREGGMFLTIV